MIEEKDWLDLLRVGDQVCYYDRYHGYVFETILKITPTKQIKTRQHTFKDGCHKGSGWTASVYIQPITKQILDEVNRLHLVSEIKKTQFEKMGLEDLKKIVAVITDFEIAQSAPDSNASPSR